MIPLNRTVTRKEARIFSLVLDATGIRHRLHREAGQWEILVPPELHDQAERMIGKYLAENMAAGDAPRIESRVAVRSWAGVGLALFLAACHAGTVLIGKESIHERLKTSAFLILEGEYYRCVTALLLHADLTHLLGNMAGIALFGTWVCQLTGLGVGIGLIVLSGAMGNYMNAAFYQYNHYSLGASTAVFSALGILIGIRFLDRFRIAAQRRAAWVQIAAGMALLAFLGSSARTDLTAHLFGFIAGTATGVVFALFAAHPPEKRVQMVVWVTTILVVGASVFRGLSF